MSVYISASGSDQGKEKLKKKVIPTSWTPWFKLDQGVEVEQSKAKQTGGGGGVEVSRRDSERKLKLITYLSVTLGPRQRFCRITPP
jgi:hypothetical protein